MGEWTSCTTDDGHELTVYLADAGGKCLPGIVVLQEIFGVTDELTALADRLGEQGFRVAVPALYDRIKPGYQIPYERAELARAAKNQLRYDEIQCDIKAAMSIADVGQGVALLGYCWGGGLAYWMAQSFSVDAVASYYGTALTQYCKAKAPEAPCLFHFGVDDPMIDEDARETVRQSCKPGDQFFVYSGAGHAFANSARASFRPEQAMLADRRTEAFLHSVFQRRNDS